MKPALFLLICFLCFSCQNRQETDKLLNKAESVIIQYPDSAFHLLKTISQPEELDIPLYNKYYLLLIQAKDKRYDDITPDTLIYTVRDYYINKKDYPNAALAQYYCGRVLHEQKNTEAATEAYLQAEQYAERTNNDNLKGLIQYSLGAVLMEQSSNDAALGHYKQSLAFFQKAKNYKNEIVMYSLIGNCYLLKGGYAEALRNYEKGLILAEAIKDTLLWTDMKHNMGRAFSEKGDLKKAESCFRETLWFSPLQELARTYLAMSGLFLKKEQPDSADYYVQKAKEHSKEIKDAFFLAGMFDVQIQAEEGRQNYQQALEYAKEYIDIILTLYEDHRDQSVLEIQKKYDAEVTKSENQRLQIEKQQAGLILTGLIIFVMALLFSLYYIYTKSRQKELEAEQKLHQFMEMAESYDKKEQSLRTILLEHFDILRKAASLETYIREEDKALGKRLIKKFNEIVYNNDASIWDKLYQVMNELNDNLFNKLRAQYPELDEAEFRICSLTYAKLSIAEISIILNISENTVQMKRSSIRKKMGIEAKGNIRQFIDENVPS